MNSLYWQTALLLAGAYFAGATLSCLLRKFLPSQRRSDYDASAEASVAAAPDAGRLAPSPSPSPQTGAILATPDRAGEEIVTISHGRDRVQATADTLYRKGDVQVVEPPAQRALLSGAEITKRSPSLSDSIATSDRAKQFERSLSGEGIRPVTVDEPIAPTPGVLPDVAEAAPALTAGREPGPVSDDIQVSGDRVVAGAALAGAAALAAAAATVASAAETVEQEPQQAVVAKRAATAEIDVATQSTIAATVPASDAVVPTAPVATALAPIAVAPIAVAPAAVAVPAAAAGPDDLQDIQTIDAGIEHKLHVNGITRYSEIAGWTSSDVRQANAVLGTTGRVEKENWIEQARILATGGSTVYSRRRQLQSAGGTGGGLPAPPAVAAAAAAAAAAATATATSSARVEPVVGAAAASALPVPSVPVAPAPAAIAPGPAAVPSAVRVVTSEGAPQRVADGPENKDAGAAALTGADDPVEDTRSPSLAATAAKAAAAVAGAAAIARAAQSVPESAPPQPGSADSDDTTSTNPAAAAAAAAAAATAATVAAAAHSQQPTPPDPQPQPETQSLADREPWPPRQAPTDHEPREPRNSSLRGMRSVRSEAYRSSSAAADSAVSSTRVLSSEFDDLKRVRGIGVMIERRLNALGITNYAQMANWSADDIARISQALDFKGRIERENWIEQARILGAGGYTEFSSRVDRGEVDSSKSRD